MQGETQSDLTLQCEAEGMPQPVISWMKDGEPIKPQDYFLVLPGGSLKILGLLPTDKGMYQCFAENELGQAQVAAYLDVISKGQWFVCVESRTWQHGSSMMYILSIMLSSLTKRGYKSQYKIKCYIAS